MVDFPINKLYIIYNIYILFTHSYALDISRGGVAAAHGSGAPARRVAWTEGFPWGSRGENLMHPSWFSNGCLGLLGINPFLFFAYLSLTHFHCEVLFGCQGFIS